MTALISYSSTIPYIFIIAFLDRKGKAISLLFFLSFFLYATFYYHYPIQNLTGKAEVKIDSFSPGKYGGWMYRGTLMTFETEKKISVHMPCVIYSNTFYEPGYLYEVEGRCQKKWQKGTITIKSSLPWKSIKPLFSLIPFRDRAKKETIGFITKQLKERDVSSFLSALVTGISQDEIQRYVFAKLGLAHLFAVSGFHFALFGSIFHCFFRIFLPRKIESVVLLIVLTLFFLFLGDCPSVSRSWFMAIFGLIAILADKEKNTINTLGLSLFFVILMNPYAVTNLSFQLTFLATAGILLFYSSFNHFLIYLFPKETKDTILKKALFWQYVHIGGEWFRKAMAINLAVHLALFPMQLSLFSKFPWHSIIYNLFFPFLVSIALFLLALSALFHFIIPLLGRFFFLLTDKYTKTILKIIEFPPFPEHNWYIETTFPYFVPITLTFIFLGGIIWKYYWDQKAAFAPSYAPFSHNILSI